MATKEQTLVAITLRIKDRPLAGVTVVAAYLTINIFIP